MRQGKAGGSPARGCRRGLFLGSGGLGWAQHRLSTPRHLRRARRAQAEAEAAERPALGVAMAVVLMLAPCCPGERGGEAVVLGVEPGCGGAPTGLPVGAVRRPTRVPPKRATSSNAVPFRTMRPFLHGASPLRSLTIRRCQTRSFATHMGPLRAEGVVKVCCPNAQIDPESYYENHNHT
jgi:hypothetical protein